jgi:2-polyprenyl-3-methyl-5-hydroxy-6-metoxy-1,4-benzoquinol methylase
VALTTALRDYISIDIEAMRPEGFLEKEAAQIQATVKNVNRGHGWVPNPHCPICESTNSEIAFERFDRQILKCRDCEVGYVDAFPANTNDVYSDTDYLGTQQFNYIDNVGYRKKRFAVERLDIIRRHLKRPFEGAKLLDVGCGTGWFLEVAKGEGLDVTGLEIGEDLARYTANKLAINVRTTSLAELSLDETFDILTLFDVLEHVTNPRALLKSVSDHLNPGGIALLFTPNFDSVGIAILQEVSSLVMPAEHLFYFNPTSLRTIIEDTPLQVLDFSTKGMDIPDLYSYFRDVARIQPVADFLKKYGSLFQAVIDSAGCANHMRCVVRR